MIFLAISLQKGGNSGVHPRALFIVSRSPPLLLRLSISDLFIQDTLEEQSQT
jgi:hypothetical protein